MARSGNQKRRGAPVRAGSEEEPDATIVKATVTAAASMAAKLIGTLGPAEGKEFELVGHELVIGRSSENAISVDDKSMSRKHGLIRKTDDGWVISDLGSGNGTLLNGEEIAEETILAANDVIAMGDSEFTYIDSKTVAATASTAAVIAPVVAATIETEPKPAPAAPAARSGAVARRPPVRTARNGEAPVARSRPGVAPRRQAPLPKPPNSFRKVLIQFGALLAIVLAAGVWWKGVQEKRHRQDLIDQQREEGERGALDAEFQEAKRMMRESKWLEAKNKLLEIQTDSPDYETKSVQQYLEHAELEIPTQAVLEETEAAIKAGQLGKAAKALARVPTNLLGQTEAKRVSLSEQLDARIVAKIAEGRAMLSSAGDLQKMEQLRALAEDVLAARADEREGLELKRQAELAMARIRNPSAPAPGPAETPWVEVQSRFRNGDPGGALALAEECAPRQGQCRTLENQIKDYNSKIKNLDGLPDQELFGLFELDRKISGGHSSDLSKPIRTKVAAAFYLKASQAKTTGNWSKAIENARRVQQADPSHAGANNILAEARAQAKEVYLRGYQLRQTTPDEAARLFKEVLSMTPKDDEYHEKAEARLGELQKP